MPLHSWMKEGKNVGTEYSCKCMKNSSPQIHLPSLGVICPRLSFSQALKRLIPSYEQTRGLLYQWWQVTFSCTCLSTATQTISRKSVWLVFKSWDTAGMEYNSHVKVCIWQGVLEVESHSCHVIRCQLQTEVKYTFSEIRTCSCSCTLLNMNIWIMVQFLSSHKPQWDRKTQCHSPLTSQSVRPKGSELLSRQCCKVSFKCHWCSPHHQHHWIWIVPCGYNSSLVVTCFQHSCSSHKER